MATAALVGCGGPATVTGAPDPGLPPAAEPAAYHAATPLPTSTTSRAAGWITTADGSRRVSPLTSKELQPSTRPGTLQLTVDPSTRYQTVDGFGAALTESSAHLLMQLSPSGRTAALEQLFDATSGAGIDLVRVPLGASDFALAQYTYDDLAPGDTDPQLTGFSVAHDDAEIVPVLEQALQINPALRVMVTPWSAPAWMKTTGSLVGGTLFDTWTGTYATYLTGAVQAYRDRGIPVHWLTLQNEPENSPTDYPGMTLTAAQEAALAGAVRAQLDAAGLTDVALLGYDHNWDDTTYPGALLADPTGGPALDGTAWHCYAGDPSAQSTVQAAHPDKGNWLTECSGGAWSTDFGSNLDWNAANLTVGAMRNWSRSLLLWNLALDPSGGPHTGGCTDCRGVLTIDPTTGSVTANVEWDTLALAGRSVQPGAVRIGSPASASGVETVAWLNPDGSHVLTAHNSSKVSRNLSVSDGVHVVGAPAPAGAVVTLTW